MTIYYLEKYGFRLLDNSWELFIDKADETLENWYKNEPLLFKQNAKSYIFLRKNIKKIHMFTQKYKEVIYFYAKIQKVRYFYGLR